VSWQVRLSSVVVSLHTLILIFRIVGAPAGFENVLSRAAWSRDDGGKRVAVGGADRTVTIWDVESGRVLYKV
jgi:WD40 repeat protein